MTIQIKRKLSFTGLESWVVYIGGVAAHEFMSRQAAVSRANSLAKRWSILRGVIK